MSYWGIGKADQKFLSGLKKKKKKPSPKPKPKPAPPAKDDKKKDKPKRKIRGDQWQTIGKSVTAAANKLSKTAESEREKTQSLKDKLYLRRSKKRGGRD